jgi:hypothetical protein
VGHNQYALATRIVTSRILEVQQRGNQARNRFKCRGRRRVVKFP